MDDAERFEALFRANYASVLAYARRRLPASADDVAADTFLVAWRRLDAVPADALPWLYGVARRVVADSTRSQRRQEALTQRFAVLSQTATIDPDIPDNRIASALARLSETDRELLLLVYWEGLEPRRAAAALGCSRAAVRTRLWRVHLRLRRVFDELER